MTTAEDIEKAIEQLPPRELARFRAWFEVFDAEQFDAVDPLAEEALVAYRAGRFRDL